MRCIEPVEMNIFFASLTKKWSFLSNPTISAKSNFCVKSPKRYLNTSLLFSISMDLISSTPAINDNAVIVRNEQKIKVEIGE